MTEKTPKDHRLFHYTPKFEYLEDMLLHGVWPRYCEEDFEWLIGRRAWLAIPMACFCDIPLGAAENHRKTYGSYAIGVNKSWAGELDINPVWYVHDESNIAEHICQSIVTRPRFSVGNNFGNAMFRTLAYIKPTIGSQLSRTVNESNEILRFEEEMEWRFSPKELWDDWRSATHRGFVGDQDHDRSRAHRLVIASDMIENVFVQTNTEVESLISAHAPLDGKVLTWD